MTLTLRAPAKINLTLHITGRRADGYHTLESLVAFAGAGDLLTLEPGPDLSLLVHGPTAGAAGPQADNLVLRAARGLADAVPGLSLGAFTLLKRLPVGAGIGGGSSDAAAALRLLARANALPPDDQRLFAVARTVGADVPVCVEPQARMMRGVGEDLGPALGLPAIAAVLVNPGVHLETRLVFRELGLQPGQAAARPPHPMIAPRPDAASLLAALRANRNDMEAAATALAPAIGEVLAALSAAPDVRLARMSGSGTTCFGLFDSCRAAARAAGLLRAAHPAWWVRSTVLR